VLLDQQNSLRLMQADPSHGGAANPSAHPSLENASARYRKTSAKGGEISPWDAGMAPPLHGYRSARTAVKAKKLKKATVTKQQQMEIPPALTALLQTVKQVSGPAFSAIDLFFAVVARFSLPPPSFNALCSLPPVSCRASIGIPYLCFLSDPAHKAAQNSGRTARCRCC
jgi:hypothetical protein